MKIVCLILVVLCLSAAVSYSAQAINCPAPSQPGHWLITGGPAPSYHTDPCALWHVGNNTEYTEIQTNGEPITCIYRNDLDFSSDWRVEITDIQDNVNVFDDIETGDNQIAITCFPVIYAKKIAIHNTEPDSHGVNFWVQDTITTPEPTPEVTPDITPDPPDDPTEEPTQEPTEQVTPQPPGYHPNPQMQICRTTEDFGLTADGWYNIWSPTLNETPIIESKLEDEERVTYVHVASDSGIDGVYTISANGVLIEIRPISWGTDGLPTAYSCVPVADRTAATELAVEVCITCEEGSCRTSPGSVTGPYEENNMKYLGVGLGDVPTWYNTLDEAEAAGLTYTGEECSLCVTWSVDILTLTVWVGPRSTIEDTARALALAYEGSDENYQNYEGRATFAMQAWRSAGAPTNGGRYNFQ